MPVPVPVSVLGRTGSLVLIVGGVTACLIAVGAVRLMMIHWNERVRRAAETRVAHLVWRPIDKAGMATWAVVYTLGSLAVLWGLAALDG